MSVSRQTTYCLIAAVVLLAGSRAGTAQEIIRTPVANVEWKDQQETVYVPQQTTRIYETQRTVYVPIVNHVLQPRVRGALNPFTGPYIAYELQPVVQYQAQVQKIQYPVTSQEMVAQTRTVRRPVRTLGFVESTRPLPANNSQISSPRLPISRVPMTASNAAPAYGARTAANPAAGNGGLRVGNVGVQRLEGDYPQYGAPATMLR